VTAAAANQQRVLVAEALKTLHIERLVLGVHDASFPGQHGEDIGRGSPYSFGGRAFFRFAAELGFTGVQLGPQGKTSPINASPYDGTLFAKSPLSVALGPLASDASKWRGLLSEDALATAVRSRTANADHRVADATVRPAQDAALRAAHAAFSRRGRRWAALGREFAAFTRQHADWLASDSLFEALAARHGTLDWQKWPDEGLDESGDHADAMDFASFCQFLVHTQHAELREELAGLGLKLYGDLQVGVSHRDLWRHQHLFLANYRMGAPPSRTNPDGQPWGYPVLDPDGLVANPAGDGPGLRFVRARAEKMLGEFDGLRIDHPHGLVCPWVYRTDDPDPLHAVQHGARLFASPDLPDHPELARYSLVTRSDLAPEPRHPRYEDDWVRSLTDEQIKRHAVIFDVLVDTVRAQGGQVGDIACEVLSTCPSPLAAVVSRHGLGRFRVVQKADPGNVRDPYRTAVASPADWVMLGTHDTPPIWRVLDEWRNTKQQAEWAGYLADRLEPVAARRSDLAARLASDPIQFGRAFLADLFIGPAQNVSIFFTDLLGMKEIYNRPGEVHPENWTLRVPPDYAQLYRARCAAGEAFDLPGALALALRARFSPLGPDHAALVAALEQPPPSAIDDSPFDTSQLRDAEMAPAERTLAEILDRLPTQPGVYLMKDRRGKIIYVGKAANLRNRVRQYFQPASGDTRDFVPLLEGIVGDIETVVTSNEKEALLLENNLIKRHQPRFNVKLTDDKNYLVLRLDPRAAWPRLEVVRKMADDGARYYGPYHSATACREALRVVNRHFQLRICTDHTLSSRTRPCLQYQIKRCLAPCVLPVPPDDYAEQVRFVGLFLEGKSDELLDDLRLRMKDAAGRTAFERAATLRDQVRALESVLESQRVVLDTFADQDVLGFHREGQAVEIVVLFIRQGKMVGNRAFSFGKQEFPDDEILSSFIGLFYDLQATPPAEVLLPFAIADADVKAEWLAEKRDKEHNKKVEILTPQRGPRRALVELARKNAAASFVTRRDHGKDTETTLARLQRRLGLAKVPRMIECFDISHVQGTDPVASMVVFEDGEPAKARYRTYRIKRATGGDDFASMYEVLSRRFRRARESTTEDDPWRLPDLLVVDGGKGQLGVALAAARDVGIDVRPGAGLPIIALAKERESAAGDSVHDPVTSPEPADPQPRSATNRPDRVFLAHGKDPIPIGPTSAEMFVLAHLRDEAHRFAVGFHRSLRKRRTLRSALSSIPGVGPVRQRALLRHFGSLKKVGEATLEELLAAPDMTEAAASAVREHFAAREEKR